MTTPNNSSGGGAGNPPATRAARHAKDGRRKGPWPVVIVVIALLALAALLFAFLRPGADGPTSGGQNQAAAPADCGDTVTVTVSVPEDVAPVVQGAADRVAGTACATYEFTSVAPDSALAAIRSKDQRPNLWVADSQAHVERATSQNPELGMTAGESFAKSPVVAVMTKERAGQIDGDMSWTYVFGNVENLRLGDPMHDSAALHALFSAAALTSEVPTDPSKGGSAVVSGEVPMNAALFEAANPGAIGYDALPVEAAEAGNEMFVTSEQRFARHATRHAEGPLVAVAPAEGSVPLDYRAVVLPTTDAGVVSAAQALVEELGSKDTAAAVVEAGFRTPENKNAPSVPTSAGSAQLKAEEMPAPPVAGIRAVITQWQSISSGLRMLTLIDTSGSMKRADGPSGMSRIELAAGAALRGSMVLPPNTEVGVWEFSTAPEKKGKWREVVPLAPLVDDEGNQGQRTRLATGLRAVPGTVGGDTPLYDTILDAVLKMQEGFDPKRINAVVVMTDGRNDQQDSMNLSGLLKTLKQLTIPGEEVSVGAIAIGAEADQEPLKQIAAATDGVFFYAEKAEDIEQMLITGLLDFAPTAKPGDPLP